MIIHLAAVSNANISNLYPEYSFENNLVTLKNVLAYIKVNQAHLIYFSSSMVYGHFNELEVKETHDLSPLGVYGALKLAAEKLIISYGQVFDFPWTIIRPSALYGPRCVSCRVVQNFIESALRGDVITISGDGKEKIDFTYINDLLMGIELVVESNNSINQIFNMTYGQAHSINNLKDLVLNYFPQARVMYKSRNNLVPIRGTLSIDKAKKLLNFEPKFNLAMGVDAYMSWYKNESNLWRNS